MSHIVASLGYMIGLSGMGVSGPIGVVMILAGGIMIGSAISVRP